MWIARPVASQTLRLSAKNTNVKPGSAGLRRIETKERKKMYINFWYPIVRSEDLSNDQPEKVKELQAKIEELEK